MAVSLEDIADDLGPRATPLTWVVTGPFLALALTMPLFGKLGDVYGHRRVYLLGLAGFRRRHAPDRARVERAVAHRRSGARRDPGRGDRPGVDGADHAGLPRSTTG